MNTHESNAADRPVAHSPHLRHVLALLLAAAALTGCARRYDMILTNGGELTNVRKPIRDEKGGFYTYVDGRGQTNLVSISRVVEIHPHQKATFTSPQ